MTLLSMQYLNWNGSKWLAKIVESTFYHYENGRLDKYHTDTRIDYIAPNGEHRSAWINNGVFVHYPENNPSDVTESKDLIYLSWSRNACTITLPSDLEGEIILPSDLTDNFPINDNASILEHESQTTQMISTSNYMLYLNWNESKWLAEIVGNTFYHYENGRLDKCHTDTRIDYIAPGGENRRAHIENGVFTHYPISNPSDVTKSRYLSYLSWNKVVYVVSLKLLNG